MMYNVYFEVWRGFSSHTLHSADVFHTLEEASNVARICYGCVSRNHRIIEDYRIHQTPYTMTDPTLVSKIAKMAQGNPGALNVLMNLAKAEYREDLIARLDTGPIHGSAIWILYKDVCDENIDRLVNLIERCPTPLLVEASSVEDGSRRALVAEYLK